MSDRKAKSRNIATGSKLAAALRRKTHEFGNKNEKAPAIFAGAFKVLQC